MRVTDQLSEAEVLAGDEALKGLQTLDRAAQGRRQAAPLMANEAFESSALGGIGDAAWRALWEAARKYSEQAAYKGEHFPAHSPEKVCVLCQQPLSGEAQKRMTNFEAFVQSDVERRAQEAESAFADALRLLEDSPSGDRSPENRHCRRGAR